MKETLKDVIGYWFDGVANSGIKGAGRKLIRFFLRMLLDDATWFQKHISDKDLIDLYNAVEAEYQRRCEKPSKKQAKR